MEHEVTVLITGDFCPVYRAGDLITRGAYKEIFNELLPIITKADLAITNLECPLTDNNVSIKKTGPSLKASPETARILSKAGFNIVTIANNHIMDYGVDGLKQTIEACRNNDLSYVGAGYNIDHARKVLTVEINSYTVAIINYTENEFSTTHGNFPGANPLNIVENYRDIKKAREVADYVIVIIHGGNELYDLPSPRIKQTFKFFAEVGASAVIGHHTHVPSGYEIHNGVPIFYSLGNFIFDYPQLTNSYWHLGYAVELHMGNEMDFRIIPYEQSHSIPGIRLLHDEEKDQFENYLSKLNTTILCDSMLKDEFDKFCERNKKLYLSYLEPHSIKLFHFLRNRRLFPSFLTRRKRKLYLNLFRCEAHRDVVENLLNKEE